MNSESAGGSPVAGSPTFGAGRDNYVGVTLKDSPFAHIGPNGLDEKQTALLFEKLLSTRETTQYAEACQRYLAALRQFGRPTYQTLSLRFPDRVIDLEEIYVPLRTTVSGEPTGPMPFSHAMMLAFHAEPRAMLVEGAPGSGKSTLVRQIARHAWEKPEQIGLDRRFIALPLRLRSLALSKGVNFEERIWSALEQAQDLDMDGARPPPGFFEKWRDQTNTPWLVLLDGFDEVPAESRAGVVALIRKLIEAKTPALLTSRPTRDLPSELRERLQVFAIEPFSDEQQRKLAAMWLGANSAEFEKAFSKLAAGEVAGTPLLLTIAAATFSKSHELPRRRSQLYRAFIEDTWQEAWRRGKSDDLGAELIELAPVIIPLCLRRIARGMTEGAMDASESLDFGGNPTALRALIKTVLVAELGLSDKVAEFRAGKVLAFLGSGSGVFRSTDFQCEWLHPTFREYLAAEELAQAGDDQVQTVLTRFRESAWRQVALFVLSILSESASVSALIREISEQKFPHGLTFAATAVAEGANIDEELRLHLLRRLCDFVVSKATGHACARLFTKGEDSREAMRVLNSFTPEDVPTNLRDELAAYLGHLACSFGEDGSSAFSDLKTLGLIGEIDRLAATASVPPGVRMQAALHQYTTYAKEAGFENILDIAKRIAETDLKRIASLLGRSDDELLVRLGSAGALTGALWGAILDQFEEKGAAERFARLAGSPELPGELRLDAHVRVSSDSAEIIALLFSESHKPGFAGACLKTLLRTGNAAIVLDVAASGRLSPHLRRLAIEGLKSLSARSELKSFVADESHPYALRRRAAEAIYLLPAMDSDTAGFLLDTFFNKLSGMTDAPRILTRQAFLCYSMERNEEALHLLDRADLRQPPTMLSLDIRGHCLERLDREDEALNAYDASVALGRDDSFSRCKRPIILWRRGDREGALADIAELDSRTCPSWHSWEAGYMLRKAGKLDEAEEWLVASLNRDADNTQRAQARLGDVEFDRGYFGRAERRYQAALKIDPTYRYARRCLAEMLRVGKRFEESLSQYDELLRDDPNDVISLATRSELLLRLGQCDRASESLSAANQIEENAWHRYLEALALAYGGNREAFDAGIRLLCESKAFGEDDQTDERCNRVVLHAAAGDLEKARKALNFALETKAFDNLRCYTIAELGDLAAALQSPELSGFVEEAAAILWPDGYGFTHERDLRRLALKRIKRTIDYPVYCPRYAIGGMEEDKALGEFILNSASSDQRTVVIWRVDENDTLYGQCNFKWGNGDKHNLKFCDTMAKVLEALIPLVQDYGARRLYFLEPELLEIFQKTTLARKLKVTCALVETTWLPLPRYLTETVAPSQRASAH